MNTILLLDLEETIIWDWETDTRLMCARFPILKEWVIKQINADTRVGLFSWAVINKKDLREFNDFGIRDDIESTHGFKFDDELIFLLDEAMPSFRDWLKMPWLTRSDMCEFWKKRQVVEELWIRNFNQPNTKLILFDDTVTDIIMHRTDVENNILELVNPNTIIKRGFV